LVTTISNSCTSRASRCCTVCCPPV
jgi:hypothetical protein